MTWRRWRNKDAPCPFVPHCNPIALQHSTAEKRTSCRSSQSAELKLSDWQPSSPAVTVRASVCQKVPKETCWDSRDIRHKRGPAQLALRVSLSTLILCWRHRSAKRQQERNRICTNGSFLLRVEKKNLLQQGETYPPWKWASAQNTSSFFTPLIFRSIWRKLYELSQQSYSRPSYCFSWETLRCLIKFLTLGCSII